MDCGVPSVTPRTFRLVWPVAATTGVEKVANQKTGPDWTGLGIILVHNTLSDHRQGLRVFGARRRDRPETPIP